MIFFPLGSESHELGKIHLTFFFFCLQLQLRHMEVLWLGVQLKLQLQTFPTVKAALDLG